MPTTKLLPFQRARRPAQIEERKEAILLRRAPLPKNGLENVSFTDIAREVGLAKSNIYRYFESREHICLCRAATTGLPVRAAALSASRKA
jgi:AcrR family transcriptional regulator